MPDREKVVKGFEACQPSVFKRRCALCPYREEMNCDYVLWHDALELLKEQEAVELKPHYIDKYGKNFICGVECGNCGVEIIATYKFCPYCGRSVKWE